jgi:predicted DNA-binding protein (MmcQ/YjbR family)
MTKLSAKKAEQKLIQFGNTLPGATEGHTVLKIRKKVFVFFGGEVEPANILSVTVKLPISGEMALTLPYCEPAGHGLGKSGWVQATLQSGDDIDIDMFKDWIVQSYRTVAPKKLAKEFDEVD